MLNPAINWAVRLGLVTVASVGAYAVVPAIHQTIDQAKDQFANFLAPQLGPLNFNAEASKGSIGRNNTFTVSIETFDTLLENYKKIGLADDTTLLFPLRLPEVSSVVNYNFQEALKEFDPKTGKNILTENRNWILYSKVPKNTEVYAPIDSNVISHITRDGLTTGLSFIFTLDHIEYTVKIGTLTPKPTLKLLVPSIPSIPEYTKGAKKYPAERGELLFNLTEDVDLQIHLTSTLITSDKNLETPVQVHFLTATDNTRAEKLIVLEK